MIPRCRVLALCGSLRRDSLNAMLLRALPDLAPAGMEFADAVPLGALPLFDEDTEHPAPPGVARLRGQLDAADAVVIASPEYNQSLTAALKNALDWASRPHGAGALQGKAVAVQVATLGRGKGARALADTCRIVGGLGNVVVTEPEIVVTAAPSVLRGDPDGRVEVTDPVVRAQLGIQLRVLADLVAENVPSAARAAVRRHRAELAGLHFRPVIRDALAGGAHPDAIASRLHATGVPDESVRAWIDEETERVPAAR